MSSLGFTYTTIYANSSCVPGNVFQIMFVPATTPCVPISTCYSVDASGGAWVTTGCTSLSNIRAVISSQFKDELYFSTNTYNTVNCQGAVSGVNAFSLDKCGQTSATSSKISFDGNARTGGNNNKPKTAIISSYNDTDCSGPKLSTSPDLNMVLDGNCHLVVDGGTSSYNGLIQFF